MRVIFCGTHGTGKTTVLKMFKEQGWNVITEVCRKAAKEQGIALNELGGDETQMFLFQSYMDKFTTTCDYVSDRGLPDVLGYTKAGVQNGQVSIECQFSQEIALENFEKHNSDIYYIYFPIEFGVVDDGVRSTDEEYRSMVDKYIKSNLDTYIGRYLTVHGTPEERFNQIQEYINT